MKPYQREIIKLIQDGKTKRLKIIPYRTLPSPKQKHLIDFIMDEIIQAQIKTHSADISVGQTKSYRPDLIIIDDIEAPFRNKIGWMQYVPPLRHEFGIVAIKATTL